MFDSWYPKHHVQISCNGSYFGIPNKYGTHSDRVGHPDWDMSRLNWFDLFIITSSREFSNYYSSSLSSDDYDLNFKNLLSRPQIPRKAKGGLSRRKLLLGIPSVFVAHQRGLQTITQLNAKLRKLNDQCEGLANQWNAFQTEISRLKK
uniref:Uncharacterized protein n=1 Tax=Cannabis sativa TaxID=3483 RepID=A0A803QCE8_CANSA